MVKIKDTAIVFVGLFFIVFGLSLYANLCYFVKNPAQYALFPPFIKNVNANINLHLGEEYYNVAKAIVAGKGFSDPFGVDTGPTAWVSPVYSFLLALLLKIFKTRYLVALVVIIFKDMVLVMTGVLIYEIAKRTLLNIKPYFTVILYTLWLMASFWWFFQITEDIWIVLLCVDIIFLLSVWIWSDPDHKNSLIIYAVGGGIATLINPVLGFVSMVILWKLGQKVNKKRLIIPLITLILIPSIWVARNYFVFDKLIPVKSNFYYEAYRQNYGKDNGIINAISCIDHAAATIRFDPDSRYKKLGEVRFLEIYQKMFLDKLARDPAVFLDHVKNRLFYALLIYDPFNETNEMVCKPFTFIIHALPFCSLLLICFLSKPKCPYIIFAIWIYCSYLIPFVLVTCYERYLLPLTAFKILFVVWAVDLILGKRTAIPK